LASASPVLVPTALDFLAHPAGVELVRLADSDLHDGGQPRTSSFVNLLYTESGTGTFRLGPKILRLRHGSLLVIAPGEVYGSRDAGTVDGWLLRVAPGALVGRTAEDERFPRPGDPLWLVAVRPACLMHRHEVPAQHRPRWSDRFAVLAAELAERPSQWTQAARALTVLAVIDVARLVLRGEPPAGQATVVAEVFAYIEEHFAEPISLDDVALGLARSAPSVARTMRRYTGRTVNEWIAERRMAEARRLLAETDAPVGYISGRIGFRDPAYFRRRFKQAHGVAPNGWRRSVSW